MIGTTARDRWIARREASPHARLRLFCFPYAGGGASIYRSWGRSLPPEVDVCPVQLPGRESRLSEPPFDRIGPLVEALAEALSPYLELPFAFYGYSNGALMSFELARELRRRGRRGPEHLFAAACPAPHLPERHPQIHDLPEEELIRELRELGGTPEEVLRNRELMTLFVPLVRADSAIHETYVHAEEAPLDAPITAIGGTDDPRAERWEVEAWAAHTRGGFRARFLPGDHFFIHGAQALHLRDLAHDLREVLGRVERRRSA